MKKQIITITPEAVDKLGIDPDLVCKKVKCAMEDGWWCSTHDRHFGECVIPKPLPVTKKADTWEDRLHEKFAWMLTETEEADIKSFIQEERNHLLNAMEKIIGSDEQIGGTESAIKIFTGKKDAITEKVRNILRAEQRLALKKLREEK